MTIFTLKIIAIITMLLDHVKYAIPATNNIVTMYIGRISYPLFAFILVEGFLHTSSKKKYMLRLFIFAIISEIPFLFLRRMINIENWKMLNVMFTLLFGFIGISIIDKMNNKYIGLFIAICIAAIGKYLKVDYGWYGISLIYIFYIFRDKKVCYLPAMLLLCSIYYFSVIKFQMFQVKYYIEILIACTSFIFIYFYNGIKGRSMKYVFYIFYPVHMLILYLINSFIIQ